MEENNRNKIVNSIVIFLKKNILGIVIGVLLVLGVQLVSADYSFNGTEIYYDNSTSNGSSVNVQGAVDELYSKLNYGDAVAGNMLKGKTALVNGNKITGTIESKGSETYTPTTSNQTIASGQYLSGTQTIRGDANLTAANIKSGTSIFGVTGTYTSDANATAADIVSGKTAYVNGSLITGTASGIQSEYKTIENNTTIPEDGMIVCLCMTSYSQNAGSQSRYCRINGNNLTGNRIINVVRPHEGSTVGNYGYTEVYAYVSNVKKGDVVTFGASSNSVYSSNAASTTVYYIY